MTTSKRWEQWQGTGFPAERQTSVIYYYPGRADIESETTREALVEEIKMDGVAPTRYAARLILDDAIVLHGQVIEDSGELIYSQGVEDGFETIHAATWVEIDEYED